MCRELAPESYVCEAAILFLWLSSCHSAVDHWRLNWKPWAFDSQ